MKEKKLHTCEICNTDYADKEEAIKCEKNHSMINKFAEKLIERLEEKAEINLELGYMTAYDVTKECIAIVKQQAEKLSPLYSSENLTSWITCDEKLAELRQDCLVTVRYNGFCGMYGNWIKIGHLENDGSWWGDCCGGSVIAWMPLPKPYKGKEE